MAVTKDGLLEHYAALKQLTPPLTENGALEDFVGLTVKSPNLRGGIEDAEKLKPPYRADDDRFLDFKDTKTVLA